MWARWAFQGWGRVSCSSLTAVDLSPLRNVVEIDDEFLFRCTALQKIDLEGLHNVTRIGWSFFVGLHFVGCSGLLSAEESY